MTTILGFSGSTRDASFNTRILRALPSLAPAGVDVVPFDVAQIPFYNQDLEDDLPASVASLRSAVAAADGIVIASPEYNHSYSALAKNVIDWASRPFAKGPILGKKAMIVVAGPGPLHRRVVEVVRLARLSGGVDSRRCRRARKTRRRLRCGHRCRPRVATDGCPRRLLITPPSGQAEG